jgi:hypothetical protein
MKDLNKSKWIWNGYVEIGKIPLFHATFLGIFEIFRGGKGSLDGKYGKFYVLVL